MLQKLFSRFLKIFFSLLYHQFAWTYDWVAISVSLGRWNDWVMAVLPYLIGPDVLEIGHGPGHLQVAMHKQWRQVVGIDASRWMNRIAFSRIACFDFIPLLVNGYAQFLPFRNAAFNQVVATFPTEYIADPRVLSEIHRVLTTRGTLIILPIAWITGGCWYERLASWLFRITGQAPEWDDYFLEPLKSAGFQVEISRQSIRSSIVLIIRAAKQA